jgi:hypothetical protein
MRGAFIPPEQITGMAAQKAKPPSALSMFDLSKT